MTTRTGGETGADSTGVPFAGVTAPAGTAVDEAAEGPRTPPATAADEVPVYLPAGAERVFGILTRPPGIANGTAVLCLHDAQNLSSYRGRVYTRLCREIAGAGYTAFRMDFHGTGDSSGVLVDRGVSGQTMVDVDAAVGWLTEQGARRIVVVGSCWGALVGLVAAARHDVVVSTCLLAPPLGLLETGASVTVVRPMHAPLSRALLLALRPRVLRLLLTERQYRRWIIGRVRRRLSRGLPTRFGGLRAGRPADDHAAVSAQDVIAPLVQRRVPIHVIFGEQDRLYLDLLERGPLPALEAASEILDMVITPVTVHGLTTVGAQNAVLEFVKNCVARDAATCGQRVATAD